MTEPTGADGSNAWRLSAHSETQATREWLWGDAKRMLPRPEFGDVVLTLFLRAANIDFWPHDALVFLESCPEANPETCPFVVQWLGGMRPRRLAWPRTSPFHGGNTGSNPVGDAKSFHQHTAICNFRGGDTLGTQVFHKAFLPRTQTSDNPVLGRALCLGYGLGVNVQRDLR